MQWRQPSASCFAQTDHTTSKETSMTEYTESNESTETAIANELAIMVSSQPWACDPPVTESAGRRILWPPPAPVEDGWGAW